MSDSKDNFVSLRAEGEIGGEHLFVDSESRAERVAARLKDAVKRAGGAGAVSSKSGVNSRTLSRFLGGQEIKQEALVALADACRVSVEWLATGRGDMHASYVNTAAWPHEQLGEQPDGTVIAAGPVMPLHQMSESAANPAIAPQSGGHQQVSTSWPPLTLQDAQLVSAALSLAKTAVWRGGDPVHAESLISALDEFYGAFIRVGLSNAARAAEIARVSEKYRSKAADESSTLFREIKSQEQE